MRAATRAVTAAVSVLACLTACAAPTTPPLREDRTAPLILPQGYSGEATRPESAACVSNSDAGLSLNPAALTRAPDGTPLGPKLAEIRKRGRLTVGVSQTIPLSSRRDLASGEMEGFEVDIANGIARKLFGSDFDASKLSLVTVPTDRRLFTLDTDENRKARAATETLRDIPSVDMVIADVSVTCGRVDTYGLKYSAPYLATNSGIMVRRGQEKVEGPEGLAGRKVCSGAGTTNIAEMLDVRDVQRAEGRPEVVPVSTSDTSDCLMLLQQGLVDAIYTDVLILEGFHTQDPGTVVLDYRDNDRSRADGKGRVGVAMAKQDEDLIRFVNEALEGMRADGSMERSRDRWYANKATRPTLLAATYLD